jgi:V/A-type H+-transporting ATPase subunit D
VPDLGAVIIATRVALLELRDERRLVQEGYELLDEKRVMLATEILRQLREHNALQRQVREHEAAARAAFCAAVEAHGFDDLTVAPPWPLDAALLRRDRRRFLGLGLVEAHLDIPEGAGTAQLPQATPELRACARAFRQVTIDHAALAARAGNLRRLIREYVRTERRARALENVLLPEIDTSLRFVEDQLDAVDQEEAVRVRNAARGSDSARVGASST